MALLATAPVSGLFNGKSLRRVCPEIPGHGRRRRRDRAGQPGHRRHRGCRDQCLAAQPAMIAARRGEKSFTDIGTMASLADAVGAHV